MRKASAVVVLCAFVCGCPWLTQPYNALIWNRDNVAAGNGKIDTGPWFEWWYYKVVLPDTGDAFYFVYGIVNPWDTAMTEPASHAFVGFGNFLAKETVTTPYPVSDFAAAYDKTQVAIAGQHATDTAIDGSVSNGAVNASWNIQIANEWNFNAMGWTMFVPDFTNIYWYPAQADALFSGQIVYNGKTYAFENAPGYQDRNWGESFPKWWAWIVGNHFDGYPDTAFAAGGGEPTILGVIQGIDGLVIGLRHKGREYDFTPNDGDRERIAISFGTWQMEAINRDGYKIEATAQAPCDAFLDLVFDTPQNEQFHDFETLTGALTVRLSKRTGDGWQLIETLHSDLAGIEYGSAGISAMDCHEKDAILLYSNM